ncbi:MAG: protein kinase [Planctomycetota bacterium]|nr:protein kinase [Planctomycetota bacterium]
MTTELKVPEVIGPYRIKSKLGQGGMGAVYHAVHETLERPVALKILPPEMSADPEYVTRFLREARVVATLRHDNVVQVYDAGAVEGKYYIAMELVEGASLGAYLEEKGALDEPEGLELLQQAAKGLATAHAKGLVHRDIKPDNMLLDKEHKTLRLVDFGLVMESTSTTQLTATGACLGTPQFMSPEQADGDKADGRTDIYSLGVTFYRAFTGQTPFNSPTVMNLLFKHKFEAPPDPRAMNPKLSENVANLLLTMMAKRREDRPQTAQDVAKLIDEIRAGKKIPPPPVFVSPLQSGTQLNAAASGAQPVPQTIQTSPVPSSGFPVLPLLLGMAMAFLLLVGAAAYFLWPKSDKTAHNDPANAGKTGQPEERKNPIEDVKTDDAAALIKRGDELMAKGDLRGALEAYVAATKAAPNEPGLPGKLNMAQRGVRRLELLEEAAKLEKAGDAAGALRQYEEAAAIGDPEKLRQPIDDLKYKLAVQEAKRLELDGDFAAALKKAEEANLIKDASALVGGLKFKLAVQTGENAEKKGDATAAAMAYDEAAGLTDEPRLKEQYADKAAGIRQKLFIDRAKEFEAQQDWKGAEQAYEQALKIKNDPLIKARKDEMAQKSAADADYNNYLAQGDKALAEKRYDDAAGMYKRALEAKPESKTPGEKLKEVDAWQCLARGDLAMGRLEFELAKKEYELAPALCPKLRAIADQKLADLANARKNTYSAQDLSEQVDDLVKKGATAGAVNAVNQALLKDPRNDKLQVLRNGLERLQAVETIVSGVKGVLAKGRDSAGSVLDVDSSSRTGKAIRDRMDELQHDGQGAIELARLKFTNRNYDGLKDSLDSARNHAKDAAAALEDAKGKVDDKAKDEEFTGVKPFGVSIGIKGDKDKAKKLRKIAQDFGKHAEEARQYSR